MAINSPALLRSTAIGTVAQLAMVIGGHYSLAIANLFAVVGMAISLGAGVLYARQVLPVTRSEAAIGGASAGGVCALIGIVVSYGLGDVPAFVVAFGTLSSTATGAIGGLLGGRKRHAPA